MTEQAKQVMYPNSVRKVVSVQAPQVVAWKVFTEQMGSWWPLSMYKIGKANAVDAIIEPRVGGRWYERTVSGAECDWGTVLGWDPPNGVRLSWHVGPGHDSPDWVADMDMEKASEVEVRFTALDAGTTIVELIHSHLERHGEGWEQLRAVFDGPGAWITILESFAGVVDAKEGQ